MRVVLADGDAGVRGALRLLLTHDLGMQVVGEASDADDLRALLGETTPELLLLDWALLGPGAGEAVARLRASYPRLRIVVMSGPSEARPHALAVQVDAFVSKAALPEHVRQSLEALRERDGADRAAQTTGGSDEPQL